MRALQHFKNRSLNFRLNALLVLVFGTLTAAAVVVISVNFETLIFRVGRQRLEQEVRVIQIHFAESEEEMLRAAELLSTAPGMPEAIVAGNVNRVRTAILVEASALDLTDISVVDMDGKRILDLSSEGGDTDNEAQNRLFALGLAGARTVGVVPKEGEERGLLLAAVAPVRHESGAVVGAMLVSRRIDDALMDDIDFSRGDVHIAFIYEGEVIARDLSKREEFDQVDEDEAAIRQAQSGQVWVSERWVIDQDSTPDFVAYLPVTVGGEIQGVIAIRSEFEALVAFQRQITTGTLVSILALAVVAIAATALFVWRGVTLPLTRLKMTAEQMANGNLAERVLVSTQDEIGQLGASFNEMAEQLNQVIGDLELNVAEAEAARERAERSDQVKSAFLASVSHELRTPLNSVINFTKFVMKGVMGPVNDRQKEALTRVVDSAKHLLNLINDVLDISKIESGALSLFIEDNVNLNEILDTAAATARSLLADKPVELRLDIRA